MLPLYTLKRARNKGLGLFAIQDIPAGAVILECPYVAFTGELVGGGALEHYVFTFPYTKAGDHTEFSKQSAMVFGDTSMINHADRPNCDWDWLPRRRLHRTKSVRKILAGEELTFDYRWAPEVWDALGGQS